MPITSLHSLGQAYGNEVQHDFYGHAMPLEQVLALHDAVSILNVTMTVLR